MTQKQPLTAKFSLRVLFFLTVLTSCTPSKPEYLQNVAAFGSTAKKLSTAPGDLYQQISDFRHDLRLIYASTFFSSDTVIARLNKIIEYKKNFEENIELTYSACRIISTYAECLLSITDDKYVKTTGLESGELGLKLNNVISGFTIRKGASLPKSVGSFLGMVVNEIGSMRIQTLQKKYLKEFIDSGSLLINTIGDYLTDVVGENVNLELSSLDIQFSQTMHSFYDNIEAYQRKQNVNPFDYLKNYNPLYLDMKERLANIYQLQQKTIGAIQNIKTAHEALRAASDNNTASNSSEEIKKLYASMVDVNNVLSKLRKKGDNTPY